MRLKSVALLIALPLVTAQAQLTGVVHTDTLWAQSLGVRKALTVYLPPSYSTSPTQRYPVLVYLHGFSGNERNWVDAGHIDRTLDSLVAAGKPEAIVVMPDGDDGWYTTWNSLADLAACRADSSRKEPAATYCVPWQHYDDYIAHDIVSHVDKKYRTIRDSKHRGIGGLSMGGYGAITLALSYPQLFGAAASHSGVLSPQFAGPIPFASPPRYAETTAQLQALPHNMWTWLAIPFGRDTIGWVSRDPGHMAQRLKTNASASGVTMPRLRIDCGSDDAYVNQNRDLHATLQRLGVGHEYAEFPGAHSWKYWSAHVGESIAFLLIGMGPR